MMRVSAINMAFSFDVCSQHNKLTTESTQCVHLAENNAVVLRCKQQKSQYDMIFRLKFKRDDNSDLCTSL